MANNLGYSVIQSRPGAPTCKKKSVFKKTNNTTEVSLDKSLAQTN